MKIFLAHRSADKSTVREFRRSLPDFLTTWLDEDSLNWSDSLCDLIQKTVQSEVDYVIIFLGKDTLESEWVKKELGWALARERELGRRFVLPILAGTDNLPQELDGRLYLRLWDWTEESIRHLALLATDRLFELIVKSWPEVSSQIQANVRHLVSTDVPGFTKWTRPVLQESGLTPKHFRDMKSVFKEAVAVTEAGFREMRPAGESLLIRANVFFPTVNDVTPGEVCALAIPKIRESPEERLQLNMRDNDELRARFRPKVGATGRVFADQCAIGAIVSPEWLQGLSTGTVQGPRQWIYVPLHPEEDDPDTGSDPAQFQMPPHLEKIVAEEMGWIISMPILRRIGERWETIGVFNIDGLQSQMSSLELRRVFPTVAPYAGALSGILKDVPLDRIAILKFAELHP